MNKRQGKYKYRGWFSRRKRVLDSITLYEILDVCVSVPYHHVITAVKLDSHIPKHPKKK